MLSKATLVLLFLIVSAPAAFADNAQLAQEIYANKNVQTFVQPALLLKNVDAATAPAQRMEDAPDCSQNPILSLQTDPNYCAFEFTTTYGWYADPVLVVTVKGFVAKSKIARAGLADKDVIIIETNIGTPLPTGLE